MPETPPSESPIDRLWSEYSEAFRSFDDLTLARWMAQTLGHFEGRVWRLSHPLVATYRLAARWGHERQIWLKRLASPPAAYQDAGCCRAPLLPLFTRDILQSGLICQHCGEVAVAWSDLPADLRQPVENWAAEYAPIHSVAHWEENQQRQVSDYDSACEDAATKTEKLLAQLAHQILPPFLDHYPAVIWEDHDECLEVSPEDVDLRE